MQTRGAASVRYRTDRNGSMPHFDPTITLSGLLTIGSIIAVWIGFRAKVNVLLEVHRELIRALDARFDQHELEDDNRFREVAIQFRDSNREVSAQFKEVATRVTDLTAGVQRLVGRDEVFRREPRK